MSPFVFDSVPPRDVHFPLSILYVYMYNVYVFLGQMLSVILVLMSLCVPDFCGFLFMSKVLRDKTHTNKINVLIKVF